MDTAKFKQDLFEYGRDIDVYLSACLDLSNKKIPSNLLESMRYSLFAGGKRIRPILCLVTASMCGLSAKSVMPFAAAIEMIHTYSLIHDDLPAMDDDDLRRGKPSNHKAFDEATAILAGDGLLTDAFSFMCTVDLPSHNVLAAVLYLAKAAGSSGMVGGQVLDMNYTGLTAVGIEELQIMHAKKTGALLKASCVCGAILAGSEQKVIAAITKYGLALGLAFQIADDILDSTSDTNTLGKPAGSDVQNGKVTYPTIFGLEQSKILAEEQSALAINSLDDFTCANADFLRTLAAYVVERTY